MGVRYVVLTVAPVDYSARGEARLLRSGRSGLAPVFRSATTSIYGVPSPRPIVTGPARHASSPSREQSRLPSRASPGPTTLPSATRRTGRDTMSASSPRPTACSTSGHAAPVSSASGSRSPRTARSGRSSAHAPHAQPRASLPNGVRCRGVVERRAGHERRDHHDPGGRPRNVGLKSLTASCPATSSVAFRSANEQVHAPASR